MQKCLITGFTSDGKSCVVNEETFELPLPGTDTQDVVQHSLFSAAGLAVPVLGVGKHLDLGVPPGGLRWTIVFSPPGRRDVTPMHHSDSFDLVTVIGGRVDLVLEDGTYSLEVGDFVVQRGGNHSWRGDSKGYTMLIAIIGTEPAKSDS
jgi:mannose-6-phosphate isomerase-like protein (cupin superfamily)